MAGRTERSAANGRVHYVVEVGTIGEIETMSRATGQLAEPGPPGERRRADPASRRIGASAYSRSLSCEQVSAEVVAEHAARDNPAAVEMRPWPNAGGRGEILSG